MYAQRLKNNNTIYPHAKSVFGLANGGLLKQQQQQNRPNDNNNNNNRGKYSTISSLYKINPSSEVCVSRMPKLHTAKTN